MITICTIDRLNTHCNSIVIDLFRFFHIRAQENLAAGEGVGLKVDHVTHGSSCVTVPVEIIGGNGVSI